MVIGIFAMVEGDRSVQKLSSDLQQGLRREGDGGKGGLVVSVFVDDELEDIEVELLRRRLWVHGIQRRD